VHVPYKGNGPVTVALLGGEIQMMLDTMAGPMPSILAGKLRPIAITSAGRSPLLPYVPTFKESGLPDYVFEGWNGVFAPPGTPDDIVERLRGEVVKALANPDVMKPLTALGYVAVGDTPQHFTTVVSDNIAKNAKIVADAGIKAPPQ
jgi:tripartite-type tricarboxylate transporter receptor subunit TctC